MAETVNLEYMPEVYSTDDQYLIADYAESVGRRDGWWAAFLVFSSIFGPQTEAFAILPPIRFVDFVIVFMLLWRWLKSMRLYGGFLFSHRIAIFTCFMLGLTVITTVSMGVNYLNGRNPFFVKDLYTPLAFIRMILIAAIAASFNFQEKQLRQLMKGVLVIAVLSVIFAFFQKYDVFGALALTDRLYPRPSGYTPVTTESRVSGTFGNPNQFGGCLVMLGAMVLAFSINTKRMMRCVSLAVFLGVGAAVVMTTASRTAFFGYLIVSGISFILSLRRGSRFSALLLMIVLIGGIIFVSERLSTLGAVPQRMQEVFAKEKTPMIEAYSVRMAMWINGLKQAADSPIIGVGPTKFFIQLTDNGYVFMILRIGIIGLLIYLAMLLSLFLRGIKAFFLVATPYRKAVMLAVSMVLINHAIFEITGEFFWVIKYGEILAAFSGILCGLSSQIRDELGNYGDNTYFSESELYATPEIPAEGN